MISISFFPFAILFIQYVIGSIVIVILSLRAIQKYKTNAITMSLLTFGVTVALWQILVFLHRTASTPADSINIFKIIGIVHPYAYGFYFLIFLSIWKTRAMNLLCLIPSIVGSILYGLFVSYEVFLGTYGWSYRQIPMNPTFGVIVFGSTAVMITILILTLTYLLAKSPSSNLRIRFLYILIAFILFQAVGLLITNFFLIQNDPNFPPIGGALYLASFAVIYYQISPSRIKVVPTIIDHTNVRSSLVDVIEAFYLNLLSRSSDTLGSKYFKFLSYLRGCGLDSIIRLQDGKMVLSSPEEDKMVKPSQILCLIDTSMTLLEKGELDQAYTENLINFISKNYGEISVDLIGLLKQHEEYLKSSRLLDRIGEGKLRLLFAPEDFKEEDLERFSSPIKSSHKEIFKASVLLEFSSNVNYESKVEDFVRESFANGEKSYIFTRMESRVDLALRGLGVNYVFLSTSSSSISKIDEKTKIIQITDISQILGAIMLIKNTNESSSIVFDSLTDLMLLTNFEQAYKASRHALDIIANSSIHTLFLIEKDVHDKSKMSAFENLFKFVIK